jgi:nucleoside-diphosphate kinase
MDFSKLTFSIIKPLAVQNNLTGEINSRIEKAGFKIVAQKMIHMSKDQAEKFYAVHSERPFFKDLIANMISSPVVVQVLSSDRFENVVKAYRDLMGATNPVDALPGTLRSDYGKNIDHNATHGSDSEENAKIEITLFFDESEIFTR